MVARLVTDDSVEEEIWSESGHHNEVATFLLCGSYHGHVGVMLNEL